MALHPHAAARNKDVTHPHVQDEMLCEGDGRAAIAAALTERRFYDFFLLVNQILHTYGQGSAFVELDAWHGTPCKDCGKSVSTDERYDCQGCDSVLCGSCSTSCQGCDNSHCCGCLHLCAACGREYCLQCLETCPVCRKRFCGDCRENRWCKSCYDKLYPQSEEPKNDPSDESPSETACLAGQWG